MREELIAILKHVLGLKTSHDLSSYRSISKTIITLVDIELVRLNILILLVLISFTFFCYQVSSLPSRGDLLSLFSKDYLLISIYIIGFIYLLITEDYYLSRKQSIVRGFEQLFNEYDLCSSQGLEEKEIKEVLKELLLEYLEPKHHSFYSDLFIKALKS